MAKLRRSDRKIEKPGSVGCSGIFLLLVANLQFVATSVKWTAPPPAWTQTDPTSIRTVNMSVVKGSTQVPLRWSYTLLSGSLILTTFSLRSNDGSFDDIGTTSGVFNNNDYRARFDISGSEVATLIIKNVTEREENVYQCKLLTDSNTWRYRIQVIVTVPARLTNVSRDRTVSEGLNMQLFCEATGKPLPNNITWTRVLQDGSNSEVLHQGPTWEFLNINRTDAGTYRCKAHNGFGTPVDHQVKVNVTYPAKIVKLKSEHEVAAQQSVTLDCQAEGNPQPTYTWTPCDPQQSDVCYERTLIIPEVLKDTNYSCRVKNSLDSDTANTSLFIAGDVINVTLVITGEECNDEDYNQLWEKLSKLIDDILNGTLGYESVQLKEIRCGRIIVDLALKFNSTVRESVVLSILQDAKINGKFGDFNVGAITGTRDTEIETTMATTPTGSPGSTPWIIVGVVVGVVVVLAVAGGVAWYVYKKRKCKKRDSKEVHNNGSQGEAGGNVQGEGYVEVNKGYEERANRHSGGGKTSSVPPVLYDTAQTSSRGAVKGPPLPQYAVVDKSKKKPKKPQPGELQYAELAEFSGQGGQRSSLSPTNRHTETQYADVNAM